MPGGPISRIPLSTTGKASLSARALRTARAIGSFG